ncbi:MAG: biotin--[acetyl-CoA-carboxylase] ligase [Acidimicrobiales bacterium]|jgi:BirA family biotin operon repressor/biotin-[acetyl-CoA-carboxylase] ligase
MSTGADQVCFVAEDGPPGTRFREVRRFAELDSTNRYLVDEAIAGAPDGLVAVAGYQSAGHGRLGRRWETPPGANLLASVLLRPRLAPDELHLCTVVLTLAAADACIEVAELEPRIKWPNDLYISERKLAGVLAESVPSSPPDEGAPERQKRHGGRSNRARQADADRIVADEGRAVVMGLGLNVRWPPPDAALSQVGSSEPPVPDELAGIATSLWREARPEFEQRLDPRTLLELLLGALEHRVDDLSYADGRRRQAAEYRRRCATVGKRVRVSVGEETFEGTAVDVSAEGHLVLDAGASFCTITAGDVLYVD